jgi:hypothetical protein
VTAGTACTDDGSFCTGPERCNGSGSCVSQGDPCLPLNTTDANCASSCDEQANSCSANDPDGTGCNDGLTCNGADSCLAGSCDTHADDCAPNPNDGQQGQTTVCGGGALPSQPAGCIQLYDCGPDMTCTGTGDDTLLGSSGTNASGQFCITTSAPLQCRQQVVAIDVCQTPPLVGNSFFVRCEAPVPVMSPAMAAALVFLLSLIGLYGLRRLRTEP